MLTPGAGLDQRPLGRGRRETLIPQVDRDVDQPAQRPDKRLGFPRGGTARPVHVARPADDDALHPAGLREMSHLRQVAPQRGM